MLTSRGCVQNEFLLKAVRLDKSWRKKSVSYFGGFWSKYWCFRVWLSHWYWGSLSLSMSVGRGGLRAEETSFGVRPCQTMWRKQQGCWYGKDNFFFLPLLLPLAFLSTFQKRAWFENSYPRSPQKFCNDLAGRFRVSQKSVSPGRMRRAQEQVMFSSCLIMRRCCWMSACCCSRGNEYIMAWHSCLPAASGALGRRAAFDIWAQISLSTLGQEMQGIKWI